MFYSLFEYYSLFAIGLWYINMEKNHFIRYFLIITVICFSVAIFTSTSFVTASTENLDNNTNTIFDVKSQNSIQSISIPFMQNMGQVNPDVKYYVDTFAGRVFITDSTIAYVVSSNDTQYIVQEHAQNTSFSLTPHDKTNTNVSSFTGNDPDKWQSTIPTYDGLSLGPLWDGIDISLHAYGNNVEKIFTVMPNHDVTQIQMSFDGISQIKKDTDGSLLLSDGDTDIMSLRAPIAFQIIDDEKIFVDVEYDLIDSMSYGFTVGTYNKDYILVIDPIIQSTYFGGSGDDYGYRPLIDSSGNIFIIFDSSSTVFPGTTGGAQDTHAGGGGACNFGCDLVISKLDSSMTSIIQSTYIGGSGNDEFVFPTIDSSDNIFISARTTSIDFPGTTGGIQPSHAAGGSIDIIVVKINNDLTNIIQATYLGGTGKETVSSIDVDSSNNIFISGQTTSIDFPGTTGGIQPSHAGYVDLFVSKLPNSLTGSIIQSTYIGTSSGEIDAGMLLDSNDNVFVVGRTPGASFPGVSGGIQTTVTGSDDLIIIKLPNSLTGSIIQSTYLGGTLRDFGLGIGIDGDDNIFTAARTTSTDFPGTTGGIQASAVGGNDIVITKLPNSLTGSVTQSTYLGGTGNEDIARGFRIAFDSSNNLYVAGDTTSTDFPGTAGGIQPSHASGSTDDIFLSKLPNSLTGSIIQSTYFGGSGSDDEIGGILIIGNNLLLNFDTKSTNLLTRGGCIQQSNGGCIQQSNGGGTDQFLVLVTNDLLSTPSTNASACLSCGGDSDGKHKSKPTFGIDENTNIQRVTGGLVINGESFTIDDNFWTKVPMQYLNVGETQNFTAKVYAPHQLNVIEFLFGISEVGKWNDSEASVALTFDYAGNFDGITWNNDLQLINQTSFSFSAKDVFCGSNDNTVEQCKQISIELEFKESPIGKILALQAIDSNRRSSIVYFNDGITVEGESQNTAPTHSIFKKTSNQQTENMIFNLVRIDKVNDIWKDQYGALYAKNYHDVWIQLTHPENLPREDPIMSVMNRYNSNFDDMIDHEQEIATLIFDSSKFVGVLDPSISAKFVNIIDKSLDPEVLKKLKEQEQLALKLTKDYTLNQYPYQLDAYSHWNYYGDMSLSEILQKDLTKKLQLQEEKYNKKLLTKSKNLN